MAFIRGYPNDIVNREIRAVREYYRDSAIDLTALFEDDPDEDQGDWSDEDGAVIDGYHTDEEQNAADLDFKIRLENYKLFLSLVLPVTERPERPPYYELMGIESDEEEEPETEDEKRDREATLKRREAMIKTFIEEEEKRRAEAL